MSEVKKKKKPLMRRVRHRVKTWWPKYRSLVIAILLGFFIAFFVMPFLIRIFVGTD